MSASGERERERESVREREKFVRAEKKKSRAIKGGWKENWKVFPRPFFSPLSLSPGPVFVHKENHGPRLGLLEELLHNPGMKKAAKCTFMKVCRFPHVLQVPVKVFPPGLPPNLDRHRHADPGLLCQRYERGDPLLPVLALSGHGADVLPSHGLGDLHHGLGLEVVRGNHTGKVLEAGLVAQDGGGRGVADLGDLEKDS